MEQVSVNSSVTQLYRIESSANSVMQDCGQWKFRVARSRYIMKSYVKVIYYGKRSL